MILQDFGKNEQQKILIASFMQSSILFISRKSSFWRTMKQLDETNKSII